MLNKFVVVDLETTGNSPKKGDKIIQFAAVVIENGKITDTFSSLLNPNQPIPIFIEELTGLHDVMVKDAPDFSEIAPRVMSLLEDAYFVAHNVLFDLSFLQEELIEAGYEGFYGSIVDTVELARILYPTADGYKLTDLAEQAKLKHDRPHQADSDAQVTAELLLLFLEKAAKLPHKTLKQLIQLSGGLKSDLHQLFEELLIEKDKTTEKLPESIEIFNGIAIRTCHPEAHEVISTKEHMFPANDQEKTQILKNVLPSYEKRTGQFAMMDGVYNAFQTAHHYLIEAGTGVGKSIGYLLPAAYFSKQTGQKIIVSTYTIQLQEQLIRKEVPLLTKLVPFSVKIVLLKGKDHYLSLEKFSQTLLDENDNYDTTLTKMQILIWLLETETGDKDELNLSSGGQIFWNKIKNEQTAFGQKDSWKEKDFYIRAKSKAEIADIVITNHSMLLCDLKSKHSLLPDSDYVILDEGHHFEKAAAQFLGRSLDYLTVRLLLGQLGNYEQKQLFYQLEKLVEAVQGKKAEILHTFELNQLIGDLSYEMDQFFKLSVFYTQRNSNQKKNNYRLKVRLTHQYKSRELAALLTSAERFVFLLRDVHDALTTRLNILKGVSDRLTNEQMSMIEEIHSVLTEIDEVRESVKALILADSQYVKWVETDLRAPQNVTNITQQPASVADYLTSDFFLKKKSVIITSATLTINHSYQFIRKELGLTDLPVNEIVIPSPFNYKNQVELLIPEDLPEIKSVSVDDYVVAITEHIITIAEATKGRMLLLFTSHEMLKKTYELIKESGFLSDFAIIAQGITSGSQTRLTRNFQRYEKAILLGTSSFWEGVDIPGEDLTCLVIVRLPFSPPDDPFTAAKCDYVKEQGGNAFSDYSLPEAVLRFKQGFGRLIRTEQDRGIIVVFDKRIISTTYGKAFLKSVPEIRVRNGSIDELIDFIHQWL
ncbi:ATP-dependent DNA helicase DinG [Bacillus sp. EB600]|uniref:ATP-dependent DNA helicase DinG n=1 Tax=Bacillus sp. EB600 TaxID=2806345 RepID=UPI00210D6A52|nr:ATP-dependent DNA helicase DinG [Bacillus sp. EB600]MCQ6277890.1 ATP-dependent DNA helicase DinG [Bacillus sp. EB600]